MLEIEAMLERHGLTEYEPRKWCQSGAQAGWSPDLDGTTPCIEIQGESIIVVRINNDIYSERVKSIESELMTLGVVIVVETPDPSFMEYREVRP